MKVTQQEGFKPITIVLESKEEALVFWGLINSFRDNFPEEEQKLGRQLSNWFSNNAHL